MTTREELLALAERVEAATGADRTVDGMIHALTSGRVWKGVQHDGYGYELPGAPWYYRHPEHATPAYTASLDAARKLVPEGWTYWSVEAMRVGTGSDASRAEVSRLVDGEQEAENGHAATPALAMTAASLRARAASMEVADA